MASPLLPISHHSGGPLRHVTVDGCRLAYLEAGQGEPIVLLHGYPQHHQAWRYLIGPLAQEHRVLALDWFGWGASDRPLRWSYRYDDEVTRLGAALDALRLDRCNLFAHDYGGHVGLGFLARHPERVSRFAILNSRAHRTFPGAAFAITAAGKLLAHLPLPELVFTLLPLAGIHRLGLQPHLKRGCFDEPLVRSYTDWMRTRQGKRWFARFFRHYRLRPRPDLLARLRQLPTPTAVIWGTADPWCPVTIAEELAAAMPDASLIHLDGASHFIMEERSEAVLLALLTLLDRPTGTRPAT